MTYDNLVQFVKQSDKAHYYFWRRFFMLKIISHDIGGRNYMS